jgi:hypothetical protein
MQMLQQKQSDHLKMSGRIWEAHKTTAAAAAQNTLVSQKHSLENQNP